MGPFRWALDVLEVTYKGDDFDLAIKCRLRELGIPADQVQ
jgi:hypothetical protein